MDEASLDRSQLAHVLAERMNAEPMILRGCTSSELVMLAIVSVLIWLPLGTLIAWALGAIPMAMGLAAIGVLLTVYLMASAFQRIKRGRPDGYYQQVIALWLHRKRLRRSRFCLPAGRLRVGRTWREPRCSA